MTTHTDWTSWTTKGHGLKTMSADYVGVRRYDCPSCGRKAGIHHITEGVTTTLYCEAMECGWEFVAPSAHRRSWLAYQAAVAAIDDRTAHARPDCYPVHCEPGAPCPRHALAHA